MPLDRTWYAGLVDDDGSGSVGSIWNKSQVNALMNVIDAELVLTSPAPLSTTGSVTNWAPGLQGDTLTQWNGAADLTVNGLAGGLSGQQWTFRNTGTKNAYFVHGTGATGNQFSNVATSAATPVGAGGSVRYVHNGLNWLLMQHEQGTWITPTYAGTNYGAVTGGATWTVDSGDVVAHRYRLSGRTLTVGWQLSTTSLSGTATGSLKITPAGLGGFTPVAGLWAIGHRLYDGALAIGYIQTDATHGLILKKLDDANVTAGTNTIYTSGVATFDVT